MRGISQVSERAPWRLGSGEPGVVSVVVTVYNQAHLIRSTLASVFEQTYRPLECVIVNDGSTDTSAEVIDEFRTIAGRSLSVALVEQCNSGVQAARNAGIRASRGEFIQFLDGDDLLAHDKIEKQAAYMCSKAGENADVVYGDATQLFDAGGKLTTGDVFGFGPAHDVVLSMLKLGEGGVQVPFGYLCRRRILEQGGPWDARWPLIEDMEFFLRVAFTANLLRREIRYLPGNTGFYRIHTWARRSDASRQLWAEVSFKILQWAENRMKSDGLLTTGRQRALAKAYREVSYTASHDNRKLWQESLLRSMQLAPDLVPPRRIGRVLRKLIGTYGSESILRNLRWFKSLADQVLRRSHRRHSSTAERPVTAQA